jgi:hypothetical protein
VTALTFTFSVFLNNYCFEVFNGESIKTSKIILKCTCTYFYKRILKCTFLYNVLYFTSWPVISLPNCELVICRGLCHYINKDSQPYFLPHVVNTRSLLLNGFALHWWSINVCCFCENQRYFTNRFKTHMINNLYYIWVMNM